MASTSVPIALDSSCCAMTALYKHTDYWFVPSHLSHLGADKNMQYWNGKYFEDIRPKSLGIKMFLGHCGEPCKITGNIIENFVIVDTNGVHTIDIYFCGCYKNVGASHHHVQLHSSGLFPSTHIWPLTAFTFNVLNSFHLLTLQAKTSAYDFYLSITRRSDNTGTLNIKVSLVSIPAITFTNSLKQYRYEQFLTTIHMWHHLKLLKRSGRAHDPGGVVATQPGDCAIECSACPHPERNLLPNWKTRPSGEQYAFHCFPPIYY
jgi:hypothetical protein